MSVLEPERHRGLGEVNTIGAHGLAADELQRDGLDRRGSLEEVPCVEAARDRDDRPDLVRVHRRRPVGFAPREARSEVVGAEVDPAEADTDSVGPRDHRLGKRLTGRAGEWGEPNPPGRVGQLQHDRAGRW